MVILQNKYFMTFGERLNSLIVALEAKNITSFEDHVEVSRKTLSKVIKEGTDTGCKNVYKIWVKFPNVNLHWLLTGDGDMFIDMTDCPKPYPKDTAVHSVVAENAVEKLKDEYIVDLKDHIQSLKLEIEGYKSLIKMVRKGEVIFPTIDRED